MSILKAGNKGSAVKRWQQFLIGQELLYGRDDGIFGPMTDEATREFQRRYGMKVDGIVGNKTYGQAMLLGFDFVRDGHDTSSSGPNWPPHPSFPALVNTGARQALFGKYRYAPAPMDSMPERIEINDDWEEENIITVEIPQLAGISGASSVGAVRFHKMGAGQLRGLWQAWEDAGLVSKVLTWEGSFVPRFIRGSRRTLSNHAFGTAFDINYSWNKLGALPTLAGRYGSVRELVPIANQFGFFWGGHFRNRYDGMHFELARIDQSERINRKTQMAAI